MPETGRPTAEAGNTYHDLVTVHLLIDLVKGEAIDDVWPEALAPVDEGPGISIWQVFVPGWQAPITLEAHFTAATEASSRALVRQLVDSLTPSASSD